MNPERRIYPRVNVAIPAELITQSSDSVEVMLINLSVGGMLVEGGEDMVAMKPPVEGAPLELYLHFGLEAQAVHCHCRVVYSRRQSQQCVQFGLSLLSIDHQALECLQTYINAQLK